MATIAPVHEALIRLMVVVSASDRTMPDLELSKIGAIATSLPVFEGFDADELVAVAKSAQKMLQNSDDLDTMLTRISLGIPAGLRDTAYAIAVEVAVADLDVRPEELRVLQLLQPILGVEPELAAAIEKAAVIRHRRLR